MTTGTRLSTRELNNPIGLVLVALMLLVYLVLFDQGAVGLQLTGAFADAGGVLHEFFHDARHLYGVPCH